MKFISFKKEIFFTSLFILKFVGVIFLCLNLYLCLEDIIKTKLNVKTTSSLLLNLFLLSYLISDIKIPTHYAISQNTCKGLSQNKVIFDLVNRDLFSIHCLKKDEKMIVVLG